MDSVERTIARFRRGELRIGKIAGASLETAEARPELEVREGGRGRGQENDGEFHDSGLRSGIREGANWRGCGLERGADWRGARNCGGCKGDRGIYLGRGGWVIYVCGLLDNG